MKTYGKPTENPNPLDFKKKYGEFKHVLLSGNDIQKLQEKLNVNDKSIKQTENPNDIVEAWIKTLDEGIEQKGYKYNNHYLTILKWADKEKKKGDPFVIKD